MSQQMTEALRSAKTIQQEMTQWENRLESIRNEHETLRRKNDLLTQEINQKTKDYEGYVMNRKQAHEAASAKLTEDMNNLESQRTEFAAMLEAHQKEKAQLIQDKSDFEREKNRVNGTKANIDGFVQAVRRAYTLIS